MTIETSIASIVRGRDSSAWAPEPPASPTPTDCTELVEPTGPPSPAGRTSDLGVGVAQWQRPHCVKNVRQLRALPDPRPRAFYADLERTRRERATMSMLVPPQMLNTMVPTPRPAGPGR